MGLTDENKRENHLLPKERHYEILRIVQTKDSVRVSELSEQLQVSEITIRRDLILLEESGALERTHGGAIFPKERLVGKYDYLTSVKEFTDAKKRIAQCAAGLIEPYDSFFLGSGVTTALITRYLNPQIHVNAHTNNLGAIDKNYRKVSTLALTGGVFHFDSNLLLGPAVIESINKVNVSKTFIGAECISLKNGITTRSIEIAAIERAMIRQTQGQVILVADHNKYNSIAEQVIAPLKKIDVVIVDQGITSEIHENLKYLGIKVLVA